MQRHIDELTGHHIVCGLGDTGRHAVAELQKTNTPHVVVDLSEENLKKLKELHPEALQEMLYVVGDATEEDVLEKAGLSRANGLIAALPLDKDNLVVTVIVRQRFPKMRIVARSAERKFAERMLRAGANSTVSPSQIGGLRMASELIRPHVVGFLDLMLKEQGKTLRVEEIEVKAASPWAGSALHDLNLKGPLQPSGSRSETSSRGKLSRFAGESAGQFSGRQSGHHHRHGRRERHPARPPRDA